MNIRINYIDFGFKEEVRVRKKRKLLMKFVFDFITKEELLDDTGAIACYKSKAMEFYKAIKDIKDINEIKALYEKYKNA